MTLTTETKAAPTEQAGNSGSVRATVRQLFGKWKFWILLGAVFVLVVALTFLTRSAGTDGGILSPSNPAPEGAMAAAQVLEQQGVQIQHTETLEETLQALQSPAAAAQSTLLLHDRLQLLTPEQLQQLAAAEIRTVLIEPSIPILGELAENIESAGVVPSAETALLEPQCALDDAAAAGSIDRGGQAYRGPQMCYLIDSSSAADAAGYVQNQDGTVTVLGNGAILRNDRLAAAGNAALTLRTLGAESRLIWYQPTLADIAVADQPPSIAELTPPWVNLSLLWLAAVALAAMLWKARRLGPLVSEPLPVWAKASETAEGRARLYQDARAAERAAQNLRAAALVRLARHFRLGAGTTAETVAQVAAQHSGLPAAEIDRLLNYIPPNDAELLRWARHLEALEKEVTVR